MEQAILALIAEAPLMLVLLWMYVREREEKLSTRDKLDEYLPKPPVRTIDE
jgi:hypothetical protein